MDDEGTHPSIVLGAMEILRPIADISFFTTQISPVVQELR